MPEFKRDLAGRLRTVCGVCHGHPVRFRDGQGSEPERVECDRCDATGYRLATPVEEAAHELFQACGVPAALADALGAESRDAAAQGKHARAARFARLAERARVADEAVLRALRTLEDLELCDVCEATAEIKIRHRMLAARCRAVAESRQMSAEEAQREADRLQAQCESHLGQTETIPERAPGEVAS